MNACVYLEGGGESKDLHARCREGFRKLLEKSGFGGRMPRLVACGGRAAVYDHFRIAHANAEKAYVAMLVDSEEPVADINKTWQHVSKRDGWSRPDQATDDQVLLMVTCTETWIACDRKALTDHYGGCLQESALPAIYNLETRPRNTVQESLVHATQSCGNAYKKGKRSFAVLTKLDPATLRECLPSFARAERILGEKLR